MHNYSSYKKFPIPYDCPLFQKIHPGFKVFFQLKLVRINKKLEIFDPYCEGSYECGIFTIEQKISDSLIFRLQNWEKCEFLRDPDKIKEIESKS